MANDAGVFVIVQPGTAQPLVRDVEAERFDQMQLGPGVGAKANDVARIGRYFGLVKNDSEHVGLIWGVGGGGLKHGLAA